MTRPSRLSMYACHWQSICIFTHTETQTRLNSTQRQNYKKMNQYSSIVIAIYILTLFNFKSRLYPFLFFRQSPSVMLRHLIALRVVFRSTEGCSCATGALGALFSDNVTGQLRLYNQNCIKYELNCQNIFL